MNNLIAKLFSQMVFLILFLPEGVFIVLHPCQCLCLLTLVTLTETESLSSAILLIYSWDLQHSMR